MKKDLIRILISAIFLILNSAFSMTAHAECINGACDSRAEAMDIAEAYRAEYSYYYCCGIYIEEVTYTYPGYGGRLFAYTHPGCAGGSSQDCNYSLRADLGAILYYGIYDPCENNSDPCCGSSDPCCGSCDKCCEQSKGGGGSGDGGSGGGQ